MRQQISRGVLVVLTALLSVCIASPYPYAYQHIPTLQQQRQFYFAPLQAPAPQISQYPIAAAAPSSNYVFFASQPQRIQPPRLVAPAPSAFRYTAPTTAVAAGNGQYVVVYPGGTVGAIPGGSVVLVGRQGEGEGESGSEGGGWTNFFGQIGEYFSWPFSPANPDTTTGAELPVEAAAPLPAAPAKPEKVESISNEKIQGTEIIPENSIGQRYVVVQQPQFFGHYAALQKANPANLATASNGAVSSFLFLRNDQQQHQQQQQVAEEPIVTADGPGSAALAYQRLLVLSKKKEAAEAASGAVTVDAKEPASNSTAENSNSNEESENVDAGEEEGPSIAQAKPQAISLAGPGGVAAAAPVGTALVGPGGMALSAPSATAVAGPSAGSPISIAPANKAAKTYFHAKQNPQFLFPYKP